MKIKPIIFNSEMVRALLDGRKTQTRRVCKLTDSGRVKAAGSHRNWHLADPDAVLACPYGQPGDLLWVREAFAVSGVGWGKKPGDAMGGKVHFKADPDHGWKHYWGPWRPSIHMPRWASRLTLEITDVRVQRVQDITPADAIAEGEAPVSLWQLDCSSPNPVDSFARTWDSTNAKRGFGWDANPWVWALTFKVHRCNVDELAG